MTHQADSDANYFSLEAEYVKLKRRMYAKFFKFLMLLFSGIGALEVARALLYSNLAVILIPVIVIIFIYYFYNFVMSLEQNQEFAITTCLLVLYGTGLVIHYFGQTGYFDNPLNAFYFGSTFTMLERMMVTRIPQFTYRRAFSIATALIRTLIVPAKDIVGSLGITYLFLIMGIYLDGDQEKHDKDLFRSYFANKDQLMKFRNLVNDEIPEAIAIIDQELTQCLFMNNSFKGLLRSQTLTHDYVKGVPNYLKDFKLNKDAQPNWNDTLFAFLQTDSQAPRHKSSFTVTYQGATDNMAQNQNNKTFEARVLRITWDEHPAIAVILHDITEQQTILSLKMADAYKDTLLATISHELRTPLNGILGMLQIMQKHVTDSNILQYIDICKNSGQLLLGLVNSILDLNQIRAKKLKLYPERVDIHTFLKEIRALFEFQCTQKGIFLNVKVSPGVPQWIMTDKNRLSQILINLVGNALKFTCKGSINILVKPTDDSEYVELTVSDTGIGIKDEDKDKLFKMFGKLEDSDNTLNRQGVGLGLTISDNLARLLCQRSHKEGIKVQSEHNVGSKFFFTIRRDLKRAVNRTEINLNASDNDFYVSSTEDLEELDDKVKKYSTLPIKCPSAGVILKNNSFLLRGLNREFKGLTINATATQNSIHFRRSETILIVDDNPLNIAVAEHFVSSKGYKVKTALYGQTAIDILLHSHLSAEPIHLVLMDCQMPLMDGYETTRILRRLMQEKKIDEIPIIALTANDSEGDRETCIKAGMSDHLSKPLKETELVKIFKKYL